jgi:hypothetical protein
MPISVKTFHTDWLDNDQVHLVVAQPRPYGLDVMRSQAPRPAVLATLMDLLTGNRKLGQLVTGRRPAVVLFPELALAPQNWSQVDEAIRFYPSPVILICGFGVMTGGQLAAWLEETPSETRRDAVWNTETAPGVERVYNGGWCWVHQPEVSTACIAFQKLTSEQRDEIQIESLDTGRTLLRIELNDLVIYPVICSDFFARVAGERIIAKQIKDHLAENATDARRILVAGLLAQSKGHLEWRTAISDMARTINLDRVNVCLSNWAFDILQGDERDDCWRDYSGVYLARERDASLVEMNVVRRFQTDTVDASVSRVTEACVLGGPVRWAFNPAAKNIWSVTHGYLIEPGGNLSEPCCSDPSRYEFIRVVRRLSEPSTIPAAAKTPGMLAGLQSLKTHLLSTALPTPNEILQLLLFGHKNPRSILTADQLPKFWTELDQGSKTLGILSMATGVVWRETASGSGQLYHLNDNVELLVWRSPDFAPAIWRAIDSWRQEPQRTVPLIVIAKATGNAVASPAVSTRRTDIASSPPPRMRSVAEPRRKSRILQVEMDELSAHLHEQSVPSCLQAIDATLATKTAAVKAL